MQTPNRQEYYRIWVRLTLVLMVVHYKEDMQRGLIPSRPG